MNRIKGNAVGGKPTAQGKATNGAKLTPTTVEAQVPAAAGVSIGSGQGWRNEPIMITREGHLYLSTRFIFAAAGQSALLAMLASPHPLSVWPESPGREYYRLEHVLEEVPQLARQANILVDEARAATTEVW